MLAMSIASPRFARFALPLATVALFATQAAAQGRGAETPAASFNISSDPLLSSFRFRSIGPASMGGRIDDIEVSATNPNVIWIGYAVGGVFKSVNNGVSFEPVFQTYEVASIGDIAIHPTNPDIVYVGTGEPNNRQTNSFGYGVYKTTDGGKTFVNVGLKETQSIGRIVIDPHNPEVVYVAAEGHLFGPNADRGVYKTTDGGRTWAKIKYIDENTGFSDIAIDPSNSNVLYAASYQRRRSGCCFNGGGAGSALWKTDDAGKSWTKLSSGGLPPGTYGRIAVAVSASSPNIVYAQIDAGEQGTPEARGGRGVIANAGSAGVTPAGAPAGGRAGGGGGGGGRGGFDWCNNGGPAGGFGGGGRGAAADTNRTVPKLDPARGGVFRSENRGRTWTLQTNCNARPMYFSQLRVDPSNANTIYVAGLPVAKSLDAGKTFATLDAAGGNGAPGHVDQHAIWVDSRNPNHLMIGNDGGLDISWDQGRSWDYVNTMATGLAYVVTADMQRPYNIYTGLQDNGSWGGPSHKRGRGGIMNSDWFGLCGGDGFYTAVNPDRPNLVYCESQDGNTNRYDLNTGRQVSIRPRGFVTGGRGGRGGGAGGAGNAQPNVLNAGRTDVYRFNWNTPYILSPHNSSIVYLGGNRMFKSYNGGDSWVASADLTKQIDRTTVEMMGIGGDKTQLAKNDGVVSYSTIVSVSESPAMPGVVWAGTDDGNLQVSRDGALTFTDVSKNLPGLPANHLYWISRVDASHFDAGTAYVSVDGHRSDDLKPYVFVTRDYGKSFQSIASDLPAYGNVQVIREDPKNKDLLYVGTEFGLYLSMDGGKSWKKFMNDYPTVRTDDILIHPREGDVIVATHGRGIWIADDITPLQQLTASVATQDAYLFEPRPAVVWINDYTLNQHVAGQKHFVGRTAPGGAAISYYLKSAATTEVKITVTDATGRAVASLTGPKTAGINRVEWPTPIAGGRGGGGGGGGRGGAGAPQPGVYTVKLSVDGKELTRTLQLLEDESFKAR
jgi:photosystem II stability/assembly factor-like uncharacterized protein